MKATRTNCLFLMRMAMPLPCGLATVHVIAWLNILREVATAHQLCLDECLALVHLVGRQVHAGVVALHGPALRCCQAPLGTGPDMSAQQKQCAIGTATGVQSLRATPPCANKSKTLSDLLLVHSCLAMT